MSKWIAGVFAALLTLSSALAEQDCRLTLATSLPTTIKENAIFVDGAIGEHPIKLVVDTGAQTSVLRHDLADQLGIKYDILKSYQYASIFGGVGMHHFAKIKGFTLGTLKADGVAVLLMPDNTKHSRAWDGLLGENILSVYDVDFDFAKAKMNLFLPHPCPGKVVYWTQDDDAVAKVPMEFGGDHIRLPIMLDGQKINAILDTGASDTVLDQETFMPLFGLTPQSPGVISVTTPGEALPRYSYTFKTLNFDGVTVQNPKVWFISQKYSKDPDYKMLLGMNVIRQLHMFISYKEKMLYITSATQH